MKDHVPKWFLLPGMGADASMYELLRAELQFEINFVNWPKYRQEQSYAAIAKGVIEDNGIEDGDIVGGSSLGGMIALEVARLLKLSAVVLIGSAINSNEVQGILKLLAPVAAVSPISLVQVLAGKHDDIITQMFSKADSEFIRAMCQYLPQWPGAMEVEAPVHRIHGLKDHVITCPRAGAVIISDAGHLLAITHAKECGSFLNQLKRQLG